MFREIRTREKITELDERNEEEYGYRKIKPEKELSIAEMNDVLMMILDEAAKAAN